MLEGVYPLVYGDPFLESCYWEKRAAYEYRMGSLSEQLRSYQMAVTQGYPAGHLWYDLGDLLAIEGHYVEARQAFTQASQAPLGLPRNSPSRENCDFNFPDR